MARVRTRHSVQVGIARARITRPGGPLISDLMARGLAVQAASKQRLRMSPQRIDTGNLINSIQMRLVRVDGLPVVRVGTNVEYAVYVFYGTIYMEANPFLRDGLKAGIGQFS